MTLQERATRARSRALVRRWEYRQRAHAKGVWFRLRRLLVDAERALVVDGATAERLLAAGVEPATVGAELHPKKQIFVVGAREAEEIAGTPTPVRLSAELLLAKYIVLVRFELG